MIESTLEEADLRLRAPAFPDLDAKRSSQRHLRWFRFRSARMLQPERKKSAVCAKMCGSIQRLAKGFCCRHKANRPQAVTNSAPLQNNNDG
jgi:hypothetical protein